MAHNVSYIIHQSFQLKEHVTTPLMPDSESNFRLFLADIGMFFSIKAASMQNLLFQ